MCKRSIVFLIILLTVLMCGCHSDSVQKGDFTFELPEGFTVSDVTDQSCAIKDSSGTTVGGFILTGLRARDLQGSDNTALNRYLNNVAWGCEFFSEPADNHWYTIQLVRMSVTDPDTRERSEYQRVLFVKDSAVYDMWFDKALMDEDTIWSFYPIAEGK